MKNLVIVESPTKAKTISKFLSKNYRVESSFGHVRDLPKSKLGVDIDDNFKPHYIIPLRARKVVTKLKKVANTANMIYFATDEDREGEAIAWHLAEILKPSSDKVKRIAFHEITKSAVLESLKNPRTLHQNLIDAQQARRILDRLVGYKLSPLLWKKIARGLSAGRVQSVAVRLIVEREREITSFHPIEYWSLDAIFSKDKHPFEARLSKIDNKTLDKFEIKNQTTAHDILKKLKGASFAITRIEKKQIKKNPPPPFTTSTLQQAANNRLGFSSKQTMLLAQQLYEGIEIGRKGAIGLITYMRTDSLNLADNFLQQAQEYIRTTIGQKYTSGPKIYKTKSKLAQEAHEAIRPTDISRTPESIRSYLNDNQFKLYQLIWQKSIASQMEDAVFDATSIDISDGSLKYTFRANGSIIQFDGWMKIFPTGTKENILPVLERGDIVELQKLTPTQHFTQPPPRYTEAALVKALEEKGIGRPSTYAPIISTIVERNYVIKEERKLKPTEIGMLVNDLLVKHFPEIVDYQFTARMESDLDNIAEGKIPWQKTLQDFYNPFEKNLLQKEQELIKKEIIEEKTDEKCEHCGKPMVIKIGRYGKFLACTGFPNCRNTKQLNGANEVEMAEKTGEKCPECGKELVKRKSRYGNFTGCSGYPECKYIKKEQAKVYADCPKCGKGKIVAKRSRRGVFYACSNYPECKNAYWSAPTGVKCPECKSLLLFGKDNEVVCSNKECGYKKAV